MRIRREAPYFEVQALSGSGATLGTSAVTRSR